jgi:hypothetical protein
MEVKGSDPKCTWEIVGIYRAPNEDIRFIESLAARTGFLGNSMTRSIIGGDLNPPQAVWKRIAEGTAVTEAFINRLVWDNGYTQVVGRPRRGYTGRLPRTTRKCRHTLRYGTWDQWPLRGVIRGGVGRKIL